MQIEDKKIEQILKKLEAALDHIGGINMWLPEAIHHAFDHALNGHTGTLDRVDIDRMSRQREESEKNQIEIESLRSQVVEVQKQTKEITKQTKYLFGAFVITILGFIVSSILQISPDLFGFIKSNQNIKLNACSQEILSGPKR